MERSSINSIRLIFVVLLASSPSLGWASPAPVIVNQDLLSLQAANRVKEVSSDVRLYSTKRKKAIKQALISLDGKTEYFTFQECDLAESQGRKTKLEQNLVLGSCKNLSRVWFLNVPELLQQVNQEFDLEVRTVIQDYAANDDFLAIPALLVGGMNLSAAIYTAVESYRLPIALQKWGVRIGSAGMGVIGIAFTYLAADLLTNRFYSIETNLDRASKEFDGRISDEDAPVVYELMTEALGNATRKVTDTILL